MRQFKVMDIDGDQHVSKDEFMPFAKKPEWWVVPFGYPFPTWGEFLRQNGSPLKDSISEAELLSAREKQLADLYECLRDSSEEEDCQGQPRKWFLGFLAEGPLFERYLKYCGRLHIFQGEADAYTPFNEAVKIREACEG
ncbi:MAG: hypothetical protein AB7G93_06725 [Bdellovibrionales bacterium]